MRILNNDEKRIDSLRYTTWLMKLTLDNISEKEGFRSCNTLKRDIEMCEMKLQQATGDDEITDEESLVEKLTVDACVGDVEIKASQSIQTCVNPCIDKSVMALKEMVDSCV